MSNRRSPALPVAAGLGLALAGLAAGALWAEEPVDYVRQVKPILAARCVACHGVLKQNGGLRLDTAALARKGGTSGPAVRAGSAGMSPLIRRVIAPERGGRMPPEGDPLTLEQIAVLRNWIQQGAKAPADEVPERDPRDHWAFRPLGAAVSSQRSAVSGKQSGVRMGEWGNGRTGAHSPIPPFSHSKPVTRAPQAREVNPIDEYLAVRYREAGVRPQAEAPRLVLIRRLYLDLIGLPPSPEELDYLDADRGPGWYERLVDRLLADPRYGERWARHWMDVWRYSDWWGLGDQLRNSQPHIWHWRDWLVEALNADMPYDEMVRAMLAADELYPNDVSKLRATGFLARNWFLFNRNQWMDETVEHVSKAFLGLTVNCAKCHDHKYDPIRQADYYRMRAFFEPYHVRMDVLPGEPDLARDGLPRAFDGQLDTPTYLFVRGQESQPDKSHPLEPGVPEPLAFKPLQIRPVSLPADAWQPERRPWVLEAYRDAARKKVTEAQAALKRSGPIEPAALRRAELALDMARADLKRVERVSEAMRASWTRAVSGGTASAESETREAAVRAEREVAAARARLAVDEAEERLAKVSVDQKPARDKELAQARAALDKAIQIVTAPVGSEERFTPLVGAQWAATRFQFSGKDDPPVPFPPTSTGRRSALADWITDRRNPLTARVAVNHVWSRHMGVPLVATVFDFGRKGSPPTHPEVLDYLASVFSQPAAARGKEWGNGRMGEWGKPSVRGVSHSPTRPFPHPASNEGLGWSFKRLHRLIVTSAAYRMSSSTRGGEASRAKDPDNKTFWHRPAVRVEAEVVRDSLLSLAGTLDPTVGGPPVPASAQAASRRRSLYFFHSDTDRNLFLSTFDGAAPRECYRREQSIIPQQALALTNSATVLDAAGPIAERLSKGPVGAALDDPAFVRRAFAVVLGIEASPAEVAASQRALAAWRAQEGSGSERTRLIWVLLNHNDFVTLR